MEEVWLKELAEAFAQVLRALAMVGFMAFVGERLVELFKPAFAPLLTWLEGLATRHLKAEEGWVTMLFALLVQGLVVGASGANAFAPFVARPWVGVVLTILAGAGGSNFWHDIWPGQRDRTRQWTTIGGMPPDVHNQL